jgi:hypothetical protein
MGFVWKQGTRGILTFNGRKGLLLWDGTGGAVYKENLQPKKRSKKYYRKNLRLELAYVQKAGCGSFKVAYKFCHPS